MPTNDIQFLRTCMTTVIQKLETNCDVSEIINTIPLGFCVFGNVNIIAKYYKKKDGSIWSEGDAPSILKCFPKTITLYCQRENGSFFKIRWFYSKRENTLHLASGLSQKCAANYLTALANYFHKRHQASSKIGALNYTLVNGISQAKYGVNLYNLSKKLNDSGITHVYTPDRHASLKIYTDKGTVCVHSTGKILYMGSKTTEQLSLLHNEIRDMGQSWEAVPVLVSSEDK